MLPVSDTLLEEVTNLLEEVKLVLFLRHQLKSGGHGLWLGLRDAIG